ncbi:MAG: hypothetical protein ABFC28_02810 [Rikenellaceae bacterium]
MEWYKWIAVVAFLICVLTFLFQFFKLIKIGTPKDLSKKEGDIGGAVVYSFVNAMAPGQKESAYLHLPTYAAGIIYHIGTFATLFLFILFTVFSMLSIVIPANASSIISAALLFTSLSGFSILGKRFLNKELRSLSGLDDYISNILTSMAQLTTAAYLLFPSMEIIYYITMALLFIWMPIGKTKHLLYFFFARFHLGFFYGWRGTWPQKTGQK